MKKIAEKENMMHLLEIKLGSSVKSGALRALKNAIVDLKAKMPTFSIKKRDVRVLH